VVVAGLSKRVTKGLRYRGAKPSHLLKLEKLVGFYINSNF
jgi:hypothetical protein